MNIKRYDHPITLRQYEDLMKKWGRGWEPNRLPDRNFQGPSSEGEIADAWESWAKHEGGR